MPAPQRHAESIRPHLGGALAVAGPSASTPADPARLGRAGFGAGGAMLGSSRHHRAAIR